MATQYSALTGPPSEFAVRLILGWASRGDQDTGAATMPRYPCNPAWAWFMHLESLPFFPNSSLDGWRRGSGGGGGSGGGRGEAAGSICGERSYSESCSRFVKVLSLRVCILPASRKVPEVEKLRDVERWFNSIIHFFKKYLRAQKCSRTGFRQSQTTNPLPRGRPVRVQGFTTKIKEGN